MNIYKPSILEKLSKIEDANYTGVNSKINDFTEIIQKQYTPINTHTKEKEFSTICSCTGNPDFVPICSQVNQLEYFQQQAKDAYKKSFYATQKDATFHKYLLCWFNDMRAILYEHGITEQQFFKTN